MSAALDALLASSDMLEITIELDSAKRSDGTLKTWYYSTSLRETGSAETPANTTFLPFLSSGELGPLQQGLSEDTQFRGLGTSDPGSLKLIQTAPSTDLLSQLIDYTFDSYPCRIRIGKTTDLYAAFILYRTVLVHGEPSVQLTDAGIEASFGLSSILSRLLDENLIVPRYLGVPHCLRFSTASGFATATRIAEYDLVRFTGLIRFRSTAAPSNLVRLMAKVVSGTDNNWLLGLNTAGSVQLTGSSGGTADDLSIPGSINYCDGKWHEVVFARDDKTRAYLLVDGALVGSDGPFTNSPNLAVANLQTGVRGAGTQAVDVTHAALFDRFYSEDEARGLSSTRLVGDENGCIGLWLFDDNTGASANDYSSKNNDMAISGTVNVDYSWQPSDLGDSDWAGKPFPILEGEVLNARAHLIDHVRERHRANADALGWHTSTSDTTVVVRSRGTVLTGGGVDYTLPTDGGGGVFPTTSQEDEPITFDITNSGSLEHFTFPGFVAYSIATERTRLTSNDIGGAANQALLLCPWPSGYRTEENIVPTLQQVLSETLGESGMHYYENSSGALWVDTLLPPVGYGPYGDPCMDMRSGYVGYGDIADMTGSCTLAAWFKSNLQDQTSFQWGGSDPNVGSSTIITKGTNYDLYFQAIGPDAGKLKFRTAQSTLASPAGLIESSTWYFVCGVFDDAANTQKIYLGKLGGTLAEVASQSNTNAQLTNSSGLKVGSDGRFTLGSIQHAQVWSTAKSLAQLQTLMATPPVGNEANLAAYIPLTEGTGASPVESVSGTTGTLSSSASGPSAATPQWAPKLLIDLDDTPSVKLTEFRHIRPAHNIIVRYARNHTPMTDADIDTGVSQSAREALKREWRDVSIYNPTIRSRYKGSSTIELNSSLTRQGSAQKLLRSLAVRFGTDRYMGLLEFPAGLAISRRACGLALMDEIGVTGSVPSQIGAPKSFRVVAVNHDPLTLSTKVAFWG